MSAAEIVFWIALFGLDFGAPLMLPERWRFRIGFVLTTLSLAGLAWSIGFAPEIPSRLGIRAFAAFVILTGISSFIARCLRERDFKLAIVNAADAIAMYASQVSAETIGKNKRPNLLHMFKLEWAGIVTKYDHLVGKPAARLVREICNPGYRPFANNLRKPNNFADFDSTIRTLRALAITSPEYRTRRLIKSAVIGMSIGALLFLSIQIMLIAKSG